MPKMCSVKSLALICMALSISQAAGLGGEAATPPNVVIILADDLGYGDVNLGLPGIEAFNNPHIRTPHLSQLAQESLVFRHHYAAAPVCSPSRAGLLTGRTPTRCNIDLYISDLRDNGKRFLAGPEVTLAEIARRGGMETAIFGKWHLNGADWEEPANWTGWTGSFPQQQGFDHGMVTKENPHVTRSLQVNTQRHPGDYFSVQGEPLGTLKGYSSDLITEAAVTWLRERPEPKRPFLLYLPYDAVHIRISSPDRFETLYETGDANRDCYYANITHLDDAIGNFLKALDDLGLKENTLVYFSSDNGPDVLRKWHGTGKCYGTSYPLHGHKYQLEEGGLRVPGMVRWPGRIRPGISDEANVTLDLFPTLCELLKIPLPSENRLDGVSLLPLLLEGKPMIRNKPLYWQFEHPKDYETIGKRYQRLMEGRRELKGPKPSVSIRRGDYVLRGMQERPYSVPSDFVLYNVVLDPEERTELSSREPEVLGAMKAELEHLHREVERDRQATLRFIEARGRHR